MITEPDVSLTDYGLAVECALFTYLIYRRGAQENRLRPWFLIFFGSIGIAGLAGGTVHGFFLDEKTTGYAILWPATLIAIGVTALASWIVGARLLFPAEKARWIAVAAAAELCAYAAIVLTLVQNFWIAIAAYLPAALFLLTALLVRYRREKEKEVLAGFMGLALTFIASGVQLGGISLHPTFFNHNALYHAIEAAALFMIFRLARFLTATGRI
jgi:hypothetical protein